MYRDARVVVTLCLDTNLEVEYSARYLFNSEGGIEVEHTSMPANHYNPYDELAECVLWGSNRLNEYWENGPTATVA